MLKESFLYMTGHDKALSTLERLLLFTGVLFLIVFVAAVLYREVYSRLALHDFDKGQAAVKAPAPQNFLQPIGNRKIDFSLWSPKRFLAYRECLLTKSDPPIAVLGVDRLNLRVPVFEGTDDLTLNRGAGWIVGTARPGETGNTGIAGHRDGFFRTLKDIATGDSIELTAANVRGIYVVDQIELVQPSNVGVLKPRSLPSVTLVTCYPFYFIGSAPQRFIVHAALKQ